MGLRHTVFEVEMQPEVPGGPRPLVNLWGTISLEYLSHESEMKIKEGTCMQSSKKKKNQNATAAIFNTKFDERETTLHVLTCRLSKQYVRAVSYQSYIYLLS